MKTGKKQNLKKTAPPQTEVFYQDWYQGLCEEIGSIVTETVYQAQSALLGGKLSVGEAIDKQKKRMPVTELVQYLSRDLKISERELWYCSKFYQEYNKVKEQIEGNKSMSWNKVKLLLATSVTTDSVKVPCKHENTTTYVVCDDCGARVKHVDS